MPCLIICMIIKKIGRITVLGEFLAVASIIMCLLYLLIHLGQPMIYLSIPMAFSIHTVTAFVYCGLPGMGFWLTAILAPRFFE